MLSRSTTRGLLLAFALVGARPAYADRVDDLSRAAVSDPSWRVRLQAVVVLGKLRDARATPALLRALDDPNETVRGLAAQVLGDLHVKDALAALTRAESDSSAFVRARARASIQKIQPASGSHGGANDSNALHIEVGGVGAKAPSVTPELTRRLRELIVSELARTPWLTIEGKPLSGFLIDSSITHMGRSVNGPWVEVSCEVSFVVGRLPSKSMVMMTSGGATVQAPKLGFRPEKEQELQVDALAGAVHGAHENLLAYLKAQRE